MTVFRVRCRWRRLFPFSILAVLEIRNQLRPHIEAATESFEWWFEHDHITIAGERERSVLRGILLDLETGSDIASQVEAFVIAFRVWGAFLPEEMSIERISSPRGGSHA